MDTVYIPTNYTDAGKLLGTFGTPQRCGVRGYLFAAGSAGISVMPFGADG